MFFYDNLAGRPGRSTLEKYYDLSNSLNKALETDELGRHDKTLLHSKILENTYMELNF